MTQRYHAVVDARGGGRRHARRVAGKASGMMKRNARNRVHDLGRVLMATGITIPTVQATLLPEIGAGVAVMGFGAMVVGGALYLLVGYENPRH